MIRKTVESGQIRQSFSHGWTKAVTVKVPKNWAVGAYHRRFELEGTVVRFDPGSGEPGMVSVHGSYPPVRIWPDTVEKSGLKTIKPGWVVKMEVRETLLDKEILWRTAERIEVVSKTRSSAQASRSRGEEQKEDELSMEELLRDMRRLLDELPVKEEEASKEDFDIQKLQGDLDAAISDIELRNYGDVSQALLLISAPLREFVRTVLQSEYVGDGWWSDGVLAHLPDDRKYLPLKAPPGKLLAQALDMVRCLKIIGNAPDVVFGKRLKKSDKNYFGILHRHRNVWAHEQEKCCPTEEANRILDTTIQVARVIHSRKEDLETLKTIKKRIGENLT